MDCPSYSGEQRESKTRFVRHAFETMSAESVLDVGANTGEHSLLAAASGASVVAIDSDEAVCGRLFGEASPIENAQSPPPPPLDNRFRAANLGGSWRCREQQSFFERATGAFDAVLIPWPSCIIYWLPTKYRSLK